MPLWLMISPFRFLASLIPLLLTSIFVQQHLQLYPQVSCTSRNSLSISTIIISTIIVALDLIDWDLNIKINQPGLLVHLWLQYLSFPFLKLHHVDVWCCERVLINHHWLLVFFYLDPPSFDSRLDLLPENLAFISTMGIGIMPVAILFILQFLGRWNIMIRRELNLLVP